jgi:hypothetical protein
MQNVVRAMCYCSLSKHIDIKIFHAGFIVVLMHALNLSQGKKAVTNMILRRIFRA